MNCSTERSLELNEKKPLKNINIQNTQAYSVNIIESSNRYTVKYKVKLIESLFQTNLMNQNRLKSYIHTLMEHLHFNT